MFLLSEDVTSTIGSIDGFGHHFVFLNQKFTRLTFEHGGVQGDASSPRVKLGDEGFDCIAMIEHLSEGAHASACDH